MTALVLTLLGGFELRRSAAQPISLRAKKAAALLAYLARVPGQPHSRNEVAGLLWEKSDRDHARKSLRQTLALLRKAVSDGSAPKIVSEGDCLVLRPEAVDVDVVAFEALAAQDTPDAMEQATALYRGDFLAGFEVNAEPFLEWLDSERSRLRVQAISVLGKLLTYHVATEDVEHGIRVAQKLLDLDPLQEFAHCALMRLYMHGGQHVSAIRQYETCRYLLRRELNVSPGDEIEQLRRDIQQEYQTGDGDSVAFGTRQRAKAAMPIAATPTYAERTGHEHSPHNRLDPSPDAARTPFVGREQELDLLLRRWQQVQDGAGQVVHIVGPPGIGKSRLTLAFRERVGYQPHVRLRYHCSPFHTGSPFQPILTQMAFAAGFASDDTSREKLDKLESLLARWSDQLSEDVPLLAEFLGIPTDDRFSALQLSPQRLRDRTLEALIRYVSRLAEQRPVLMIVEDAQWIDPSTEEFFERLIAQSGAMPAMIIVTSRPGYSPPWNGNELVTTLPINSLDHQQATTLAESIAGHATLGTDLCAEIVSRTEGVPLFIEEATKDALRSVPLSAWGKGEPESKSRGTVPSSLMTSLSTRLDRLGPLKNVAQTASVIGRDFTLDLLAAISPLAMHDLHAAVVELTVSELLIRRDGEQGYSFGFKHALLRDAAYEGLPPSRRRKIHQHIAQVLEQRCSGENDGDLELLAHHYTRSGLSGKAIAYWQKAGQRALEQCAYVEAVTHFQAALDIIHNEPSMPPGCDREVDLQLGLGAALISCKGYGAEDVRRTYARAIALCRQTGDQDRLFPALRGLWNCHAMRGELDEASRLASQLTQLADSSDHPERKLVACRVAGTTRFSMGDFQAANLHFDDGVHLYKPDLHLSCVRAYGEDPGLWCYNYLCWTNDWLGHRDLALEQLSSGLTIARQVPTRSTLANVLACAATFHQYRREPALTLDFAEQAIQVSDEFDIPQQLAWGTAHMGWALAQLGSVEDGVHLVDGAITSWRKMEGVKGLPHFLTLLADTCLKAGKLEWALAALDEAERIVRETKHRSYEAEIHCVMGHTYLLTGNDQVSAEISFHKAIEVADLQGARSLKLRAATNLARLWRDQNKSADARNLLAPIYDWFTEGFGTPDLKDARALLEEIQ